MRGIRAGILVVIFLAGGFSLDGMGPEPELIRVDQYLPQVIIDLRYATKNNFYPQGNL